MKSSITIRNHLHGYLLKFTAGLSVGIPLIIAIIACSSPFQEPQDTPTDISGVLTYKEISKQGFMGGSILYNPDNPLSGQLVPGATVATRLGFVTSAYVGNDQYIYTDIPEKAQYGTIHISAIDKNSVTFTYKAYSPQGDIITNTVHTVTLNNPVDINGDGSPDITYETPKRKRIGFENAVYLTFISSQEKLTTSMFAVLPNQYSRSLYPNGIIGINPDGRFIVNKYDVNTTNRAVISGLQKGDFVVDSIAGKYQRVISSSPNRGARAIADTELEDVESSNTPISYRFIDADFTEGYTVERLFAVLPEVIKNTYQNDVSVDTLNLILENKDLIIIVSQFTTTPIPVDIFSEVIAQITSLTPDELIQLNRTFLQETYPNVCPEFINPNDGFTQIIPLACFVFGETDPLDEIDYQNTIRAISRSEYDLQQEEIRNKFKAYQEVFAINLKLEQLANILNIDTKGLAMSFDNSFVKIGIKGTFSITWENVKSTVEGVAYLNADMRTNITSSFNKSLSLKEKPLFSFEKDINIPVFSYGPIILNIKIGLGTSVPLSFGCTIPMTMDGRFAFTGLYGAGVGVDISYGIRWKKIWFVKIPTPYISRSSRSWQISNNAYYVGSDPTSLRAGFENAYITITPNVHGSIGVNISQVVGAGIGLEYGIEQKLDISYASPILTGTATSTAYTKVNAYIEAGIVIPIIEKRIGSKWDFDIIKPIRKELRKAVIFRKNI